jgi:hypothetical protein
MKHLQNINEFGPMAGSGNSRNSDTRDLVNQVNKLDQFFMHKVKNRKAEIEWEVVVGNYLDGNSANYWNEVDDREIQNAIDDAGFILKKHNLTFESIVNEAKVMSKAAIMKLLKTLGNNGDMDGGDAYAIAEFVLSDNEGLEAGIKKHMRASDALGWLADRV